jgi:DNA-binding MarR family transcriptional regulator
MARRQPTAIGIRAFNRFYTEQIGALDERHEGLAVTLAESRCLFTVRRLGAPDIGQIAGALGLELSYVSRLVSRLERRGHLRRAQAEDDRRRRVVTLTRSGGGLLAELEQRSNARMDALTAHLGPQDMKELLDAMDTIRRLVERNGAQ